MSTSISSCSDCECILRCNAILPNGSYTQQCPLCKKVFTQQIQESYNILLAIKGYKTQKFWDLVLGAEYFKWNHPDETIMKTVINDVEFSFSKNDDDSVVSPVIILYNDQKTFNDGIEIANTIRRDFQNNKYIVFARWKKSGDGDIVDTNYLDFPHFDIEYAEDIWIPIEHITETITGVHLPELSEYFHSSYWGE